MLPPSVRSAAGAAADAGPPPHRARALTLLWGAAIGFSLGSALLALLAPGSWGALMLEQRLAAGARLRQALLLLAAMGAGAVAPVALSRFYRLDALGCWRRVRRARPLALLFVVPALLDAGLWARQPHLMFVVAGAVAVALAFWTPLPSRRGPGSVRRWRAVLALAIAAWVAWVSLHTIQRHRSLQSHAYDLGIMENVFWNSVHGDLFASSIESEGSHLGVHTSFLYALFFPLYALFPRTETLLILQALALALAAWPLFRIAERLLGSPRSGAVVAGLYLIHPGVARAAFFDFHELAFVPLFFFLAVDAWLAERRLVFWVSLVGLLAVKEDMAIVVALLGAVAWWQGESRRAGALVAVGAAAYLLLTHVVLRHFGGRAGGFGWYYAGLIGPGEGGWQLAATALVNPFLVLQHVATPERLLFVLQIFAPFAFLCFLSFRGAVLVSYGLAATLLATRPDLYRMAFQYSLLLVPFAAVGLVLALQSRPPAWRQRALLAAGTLALVTATQYGMVAPRQPFQAGFSTYDFDYDAAERQRYRHLRELVAQIHAQASVTASEELVPHVARRRRVQTERYARGTPAALYDYHLLRRGQPEIAPGSYQPVAETECCVLYRNPDLEAAANR